MTIEAAPLLSALSQDAVHAESRRSMLVVVVILALFVLAAGTSALRKDINRGFDEAAHLSYVVHLQRSGEAWPGLEDLRLLDAATLHFSAVPNYLNHVPVYYWLIAHLGPTIAPQSGAVVANRLINVLIASIGLAALLALAVMAGLTLHETYAYAVPLAAIPVLAPLAGAINNDNLAFAGGAVATLAAWRHLQSGRTVWLLVALAATVVASSAKLTALVLTGTMIAGVLAYLLWGGRLRASWALAAAIAALAAAAPYLLFVAQYGSPAPDTPGQIAMLKSTAPAIETADEPRRSFAAFAADFGLMFVEQWMPTLAARNAFHYAMLALPLASMLCGFTGIAFSAGRIARRAETPGDVIVLAGAVALAATFACHLVFSYRHHLAYASIPDAYPRYYLPLAAILPLAGLSLMAELRHPASRTLLTAVLIAGPILFRLLGAPIAVR